MKRKIINYFESDTHNLYEIKYTDIPINFPNTERYKWIYECVDGKTITTLPLHNYQIFPDYILRTFGTGILIELTCYDESIAFYNGEYFKNEYYKKTHNDYIQQ
jgi:hypothetical protein